MMLPLLSDIFTNHGGELYAAGPPTTIEPDEGTIPEL
jgi:hypothetical protein